jgi:hypothetical protein
LWRLFVKVCLLMSVELLKNNVANLQVAREQPPLDASEYLNHYMIINLQKLQL